VAFGKCNALLVLAFAIPSVVGPTGQAQLNIPQGLSYELHLTANGQAACSGGGAVCDTAEPMAANTEADARSEFRQFCQRLAAGTLRMQCYCNDGRDPSSVPRVADLALVENRNQQGRVVVKSCR
jgi:hypothetical protein